MKKGDSFINAQWQELPLKRTSFDKELFMTRKGFLEVIVIIAMMSFAFISCSGSGKGGLSGTWESDDLHMKWTFSGNKLTQEVMGMKVSIPYTIKKNAIVMVYEGAEVAFDYKIDGNTLTINMMLRSVEFKRVGK